MEKKEILFQKKDRIKVIATVSSYIDSLDENKQYTLVVQEKKKKRSLNANAYAWTLAAILTLYAL